MKSQSTIDNLKSKIRNYWPLIKSIQTGLLLATGIAGYLGAHVHSSFAILMGVAGSLFLAIAAAPSSTCGMTATSMR